MRRKDRTQECVPDDSITLDNYLINLLREEEMIEAIGMVEPEKALKMSRKLEEDLQHPWHYLNKHNRTPVEKSLEAFRKLKKEAKEAEEIEKTETTHPPTPQPQRHIHLVPQLVPRESRMQNRRRRKRPLQARRPFRHIPPSNS
jgi:hypothetical protein